MSLEEINNVCLFTQTSIKIKEMQGHNMVHTVKFIVDSYFFSPHSTCIVYESRMCALLGFIQHDLYHMLDSTERQNRTVCVFRETLHKHL